MVYFVKGTEPEQGATYGYYLVLPYKNISGGTGLWALPLAEVGGFAGGREGAGGWAVSTGATGTRWDKMGMGANQMGKVSVGVWREKVHFDGCLICV